MILTEEQLDEIKRFIRQRGFTEVDLQYEILDQMISKIDRIRNENPSMNFDDAVSQAHREYGVHGFAVLEDGIRKELIKDYWQQIKMEFKTWLMFPRNLLTLGSAFLLAHIYRIAPPLWVLLSLLFVFVSSHIYLLIKFRKPLKRYRQTLINKVQLGFTVVLPLVFLQILTRAVLHVDQIIGALEQSVWSVGFAVIALLYVFMLLAMARIMRYSIRRIQLLEERYGSFFP